VLETDESVTVCVNMITGTATVPVTLVTLDIGSAVGMPAIFFLPQSVLVTVTFKCKVMTCFIYADNLGIADILAIYIYMQIMLTSTYIDP